MPMTGLGFVVGGVAVSLWYDGLSLMLPPAVTHRCLQLMYLPSTLQ